MSRPRIAMVVQRYGQEVAGGAESVARGIARKMAAGPWEVEVLTTCAIDYATWRNHYPAEVSHDGSVLVRRFPVERERQEAAFTAWCGRIEHQPERVSPADAEAWMRAQGPDCPQLTAWIADNGHRYAGVMAFTYLYATTVNALRAAPKGKRILVPFAHNEWPLRLPIWPEWFAHVDRLVYSTEEEESLLTSRFPALRGRGSVVGQGFTPPPPGDADRFRQAFGIYRDFLLYCGRIDLNKGVDILLEQHARWRLVDATAPDLVLIGQEMINLPAQPGVHRFGFVPDAVRADALAACRALINPSALESFSLVLLEAWAAGRPTLCNAACAVMVGQSRRSGGGLWYRDDAELRAAWDMIRHSPPDAGAAGRWVFERYAWPAIIAGYEAVLPKM